jgi:hypothetical protein
LSLGTTRIVGFIPSFNDTLSLLVELIRLLDTFGVGERLTHLCLNAYGGHFLRMKQCILQLTLLKEQFAAIDMMSPLEGGESYFGALLINSPDHLLAYKELAHRGWITKRWK